MIIRIVTQIFEPMENGRDKMRGGCEYVLPLSLQDAIQGSDHLFEMVEAWEQENLQNEYVIGWEVEDESV